MSPYSTAKEFVKNRVVPVGFKEHVTQIVKLAGPVLLANIGNFGMAVTDTMFLGHLGEESFGAAALSTTYSSCTIWLALAMIFGMDTLVSQAYGAGNYKLVGVILQNVLFIGTMACIPVAFLWLFTEDIMLLLGQNAALAAKAGLFSKYLLPGLLPYMYFSILQRYLQNQGIVTPSLIVGTIGFLLNILFNYLFIYTFGFGFIGSAIATSLSRTMIPVILLSYVLFRGLHKKTWHGWSCEMFSPKRLKNYLRFGVGGGLMVLFEVWGFEATTILAGLLGGAVALNAHTISFNSLLISFTIPLSISIGTSTRVGQLLGEGVPMKARDAARSGAILILSIMSFNSIAIISLRHQFAKLYTNDEKVLEIVPGVLVLCAIAAFLDGIQVFMGGIMRGTGTPKAGTILNFIGYYLIAMPSYAFFGYYLRWGIYGIWTGLPLGLLVICLGCAFFVIRIDWVKESINAQERSEKKKVSETQDEVVELKPFIEVNQDEDDTSTEVDTSIAIEEDNEDPSVV